MVIDDDDLLMIFNDAGDGDGDENVKLFLSQNSFLGNTIP